MWLKMENEMRMIELLESINEKLNIICAMEKVNIEQNKSKPYQQFLEWAKQRKYINPTQIMKIFGVTKPTALKWLKSLSVKYEAKIVERKGRFGSTVAIMP